MRCDSTCPIYRALIDSLLNPSPNPTPLHMLIQSEKLTIGISTNGPLSKKKAFCFINKKHWTISEIALKKKYWTISEIALKQKHWTVSDKSLYSKALGSLRNRIKTKALDNLRNRLTLWDIVLRPSPHHQHHTQC